MSEGIVDSGSAIGRGGGNVLTSVVKDHIEHFIVMSKKDSDALTRTSIPDFTRLIHAASDYHRTIPVKLCTTDFGFVTDQRMNPPEKIYF